MKSKIGLERADMKYFAKLQCGGGCDLWLLWNSDVLESKCGKDLDRKHGEGISSLRTEGFQLYAVQSVMVLNNVTREVISLEKYLLLHGSIHFVQLTILGT